MAVCFEMRKQETGKEDVDLRLGPVVVEYLAQYRWIRLCPIRVRNSTV